MHRCLQIVEIAEHIARCLPSGPYAENQSLVNMGLACRALYDPAMNALWATLENLLPLLYCLPDNAVQYKENDESPFKCKLFWVRLFRGCLTSGSP